jgi:hypothetical protein
MGNRGPKLDLGDRGDRNGLRGYGTGLTEGGFSFLDERLHGVERLAEVDHAVIDGGAYTRVTIHVGDELHRIVRFLLLPFPCGSL